ncbi:YbaB/EbfC family nucleoid-associated protein [Nocardia lijiangensis]|uniref:YbaB/EbfC family nucleoid-associated protein n=1 Tax=Nocardia lijiangensis TaxID=299618 RepID=UPI003D75B0B0
MVGFDPSRAAEDLAQYATDLEQKARRYGELQGRMTAVSASASSAGGRVSVTVDSTGVPTAIDLSSGARSMEPAALSAEILSCMRKAQVKLRAEVADVVHATVGNDSAGASIIAALDERFPDPEPEAASEYTLPQPTYTPPSAAQFIPPRPVTPPPPAAAPPAPDPAQPSSGYTAGWPTESPTARPRTRKPDRDQVVTPDEPDDDDEYYNKKSWLV